MSGDDDDNVQIYVAYLGSSSEKKNFINIVRVICWFYKNYLLFKIRIGGKYCTSLDWPMCFHMALPLRGVCSGMHKFTETFDGNATEDNNVLVIL